MEEEGDFVRAIKKFKEAWDEARKAQEEATSSDKRGIEDANETYATDEIPDTYVLDANYPNPFNPITTIRFGLPESSDVRVEVYDMIGRRVAVLVDQSLIAGYHVIRFNASNLASGLYLYRMNVGDFTQVRKMVILK